MKDRVVPCVYYAAETHCDKNREGTFWKYCQKCDKYTPIAGGKPARTDTRRQRLKRIERKEERD